MSTPNSADNYAVIFSGGESKAGNTSVFYDEVVRLYNILVNDYNLSRSNIYILSADGNDTAYDQNISADDNVNIYINSDMSFAEGSPVYSATKTNLNSVMTTINGKMDSDDHLLVFVGDHGNGDIGNSTTFDEEIIAGWGCTITDEEFASAMFKVTKGYATLVLTQCFSGGILDNVINPLTGASKAPSGNNTVWYGMAAANHYEFSNFDYDQSYNVSFGYDTITRDSEISFAVSFLDAIDPSQGNKTYTQAAFTYAKACDCYAASGTYSNNAGGYIVDKEHPWGAGVSFSIFANTSTRQLSSIAAARNSIVADIPSEAYAVRGYKAYGGNSSDCLDVCLALDRHLVNDRINGTLGTVTRNLQNLYPNRFDYRQVDSLLAEIVDECQSMSDLFDDSADWINSDSNTVSWRTNTGGQNTSLAVLNESELDELCDDVLINIG